MEPLTRRRAWKALSAHERLIQLAEESGLRQRIDAMFRRDRINLTENRPVLHVALREPKGTSIVDGEDIVPEKPPRS
jgi:glucose-6-phosphate isomerase